MSNSVETNIAKTLTGWQFTEANLRELAEHDCCSPFVTGEWCEAGRVRHWHAFRKDLARRALDALREAAGEKRRADDYRDRFAELSTIAFGAPCSDDKTELCTLDNPTCALHVAAGDPK